MMITKWMDGDHCMGGAVESRGGGDGCVESRADPVTRR